MDEDVHGRCGWLHWICEKICCECKGKTRNVVMGITTLIGTFIHIGLWLVAQAVVAGLWLPGRVIGYFTCPSGYEWIVSVILIVRIIESIVTIFMLIGIFKNKTTLVLRWIYFQITLVIAELVFMALFGHYNISQPESLNRLFLCFIGGTFYGVFSIAVIRETAVYHKHLCDNKATLEIVY